MEIVDGYIKNFLDASFTNGCGSVEYHKRIEALTKYINYIKKEAESPDLIPLSNAIEASFMKQYEHTARNLCDSQVACKIRIYWL